ncbi:MAG: VCBS repeat-containing protein [Bryobacteraceae bacterium]
MRTKTRTVLLVLLLSLGLQAQNFGARKDYYAVGQPYPCVFDANGDGIPDVITTAIGGVQSSFGNGDGSFRNGPITSVPGYSIATLAWGDFNADGRPDLVAGAQRQSDFQQGFGVLLGRGDGTFLDLAFYPAADTIYGVGQMLAADFNRDGKLDVVSVFSWGTQTGIGFSAGRGDGTLSLPVMIPIPTFAAFPIAMGDFNRDGSLDIALTGPDGVWTMQGDGKGGFVPGELIPAVDMSGVAAGDVNGDGFDDIIATSVNGDLGWVALGKGDGHFQTASRFVLPGGGSGGGRLALVDVNADGFLDVVSGSVYVAFGKGDGSFELPRFWPTTSFSSSFAAARLRKNGPVDLIVQGTRDFSALLNKGNGTFEEGLLYPAGAPGCVAVADYNMDGQLDVAVADASLGVIRILNGTGSPKAPLVYHGKVPFFPSCIYSADMNGDGLPDLVATKSPNALSTTVLVFPGHGDGSFGSPSTLSYGFSSPDLTFGDLNGDGKMDIILSLGYVLYGNGDGTLQPPLRILPTTVGPVDVQASDLNGDGKLDLVFCTGNKRTVWVGLNQGGGTMQYSQYEVREPGSAVVADFTGDGILDLAIANYPSMITLLKGVGDGTFVPGGTFSDPALPGTSLVRLGDFNRDGKPDLAVANGGDGNIAILLGHEDGTFTRSQLLGVYPGFTTMHTVSLHGHPGGLPRDIVATAGPDLWVLINWAPSAAP